MSLPKLKKVFVSETCLRYCAIDLQISFLALAIASKKPSVKLAQSGRDLVQSVKLGLASEMCLNLCFTWMLGY